MNAKYWLFLFGILNSELAKSEMVCSGSYVSFTETRENAFSGLKDPLEYKVEDSGLVVSAFAEDDVDPFLPYYS